MVKLNGSMPAALAKHQRVGMALRRQEGGARGRAGDDGVDRMRRAVHEDFAAAEIVGERFAGRFGRDPQARR